MTLANRRQPKARNRVPFEKMSFFVIRKSKTAYGSYLHRGTESSHFFEIHMEIFIDFRTRFSCVEGRGSRGTRNILQSAAIADIICWGPQHDGNKQGGRCYHTTWSLIYHWAAFPWVQPTGLAALIFTATFWSCGRIIVAKTSIFGGVARHQNFTNLTAEHFFARSHTVNSSQKSYFCR